MVRIRITEWRHDDNHYKAVIEKDRKEGIIARHYISKAKQREVAKRGVAFVNQPKERVL